MNRKKRDEKVALSKNAKNAHTRLFVCAQVGVVTTAMPLSLVITITTKTAQQNSYYVMRKIFSTGFGLEDPRWPSLN